MASQNSAKAVHGTAKNQIPNIARSREGSGLPLHSRRSPGSSSRRRIESSSGEGAGDVIMQ